MLLATAHPSVKGGPQMTQVRFHTVHLQSVHFAKLGVSTLAHPWLPFPSTRHALPSQMDFRVAGSVELPAQRKYNCKTRYGD